MECELKLFDLIVPAITTLGAAFLGAWYAFKLQDRDHERKLRKSAVAAGNRAIFSIMKQWNSLKSVQRQVIEPVRSHPLNFVAMLPMINMDYQNLKLDIDGLIFLLETEHRQCLMDLFMAESQFKTAMSVLEERSKLHSLTIQPLLEKAGVIEGGNYTKKQIETALGERFFLQISRLTDDAIEHVDHTINFLKETSDKLRVALVQLYPHEVFIDFKPLE